MRDPEDEIFASGSHYKVLELERKGDEFIMRAATEDSGPLETIGSHIMQHMPSKALVGIFICSHDPDVLEEARFFDVKFNWHDDPEPSPYDDIWQ
jgi:hypothetical protein